MATRPVFVPDSAMPRVRTLQVEFEWFPGFAAVQQQRSIASLHRAAAAQGVRAPLEISSRSPDVLGTRLSAFNLRVTHPDYGLVPLESAYQAAKVFEDGSSYAELAQSPPRDAKTDARLRDSGRVVAFRFG